MDRMSRRSMTRDEAVNANYSKRALAAVQRGENTWTNWRQRDLIAQILRVNKRQITARELKRISPLEYLKVKFLTPTHPHHVRLGQSDDLSNQKRQFYGLDVRLAEKVDAKTLQKWIADKPNPDELDEAVENRTGQKFYRNLR